MSYITTVTGKHFDPMEPETQEIELEDIAHALSLLCRANGHFKRFYSVAQHSIACAEEALARGCSPEVILGSLLHDASEAYLSDVTRPVKSKLPQYRAAEDRLQQVIWQRLIGRALTAEELRQIFEIDDLMLSMEFHQLMPEDLNGDYTRLVSDVVCAFLEPQQVKERFIRMATLEIEVERLLEEEYRVIDVVPAQTPVGRENAYIAAEQDIRSSEKLPELFQRYAAILCQLSVQYSAALVCMPEDEWTVSPGQAVIQDVVAAHAARGSVGLLLPGEHTLLLLNGGDLHLTVYHPSEATASFLQAAAAEQGLFLWQPPQLTRIRAHEAALHEARELLQAEKRSPEENKRLQILTGELAAYYDSAAWREDFAAEEAGLLPKRMPRGVLSEDGIYLLLEEYREQQNG